MLDLLLACGNELVEGRAHAAPEWWMWSQSTRLGLLLGVGAPTAALTGVSIFRWVQATTGLQRAAAVGVGASVGLGILLAALFSPDFPPLTLALPMAPLLLARLRKHWSPGDERVAAYPPVKEPAACSG